MSPTSSLLRLCVVFAVTARSFGLFIKDPSQITSTTYDYIVIGGGTAGCVVANRLSEKSTVLLIEAGDSDQDVLASHVPLLAPFLSPNTPYDWNYTTTAQTGYNGRTVAYRRGRILGGSSSINYMVYNHGSLDDWNRYASITGDSGWSWSNIQRYVQMSEKFIKSTGEYKPAGEYTPPEAGTNGMVSVSFPSYETPLDKRVVATTEELPQFPFTQDYNGGNVLGIGWTQSSIGEGTRSSSSAAYLTSQVTSRPNLTVLLNTQVTKLVQTGTAGGLPSFRSVTATSTSGVVKTFTANKEVILSAGAVNSPQLLMLSGIGDPSDLSSVGISTIVNLPSVGKNMSDHVLIPTAYTVNSDQTFDPIYQQTAVRNSATQLWTANKSGPLGTGTVTNLGFMRVPPSILGSNPDPSPGSSSAHYEMLFGNLFIFPGVAYPASGNFLSVTLALISPTSRGSIKLSSSDPLAKPIINPNYLTTALDVAITREAVRASQKFVSASPWKNYITGPYGSLAGISTDDEIDAYVRETADSVWHMVGTAGMSPKGASWGVVDPDLKVKGVDGLRVVDASILPFVPSAHTQGPVYILAERGAAMIIAGQ